MRILEKQRNWLSLLAGLMYGLAWEPFGLWPLAIAGWALWLNGLAQRTRRDVFLHTLLFSLAAWLIAFHWVMAHPIPAAAMTSGVALLAFASVFATITALLVPLVPECRRGLRMIAGIVAALCFEALLFLGPFAMPWLSAGLSTAPSSWTLSVGSFFGFQGASLLLVSTAALFALSFRLYAVSRRRALSMAGLALGLILVPMAIPVPGIKTNETDWHVRMLEPGLSPAIWSDVNDFARVDRFAAALNAVPGEADLAVLPETALPMAPADSLHAWVARLADVSSSVVVAGGIEAGDASSPSFNVAYSSDSAANRHAKQRLVPFAERVPFSKWIPGFDRFSVPSGGVSSYAAGSGTRLLQVDGKSIVALICFESLFARDARKALLDGGSILVVMTQDGWWGSDLPRGQHLAFSQMLAASTGHPLVHATVDGMSGLIASDGSLQPLESVHPWILSGTLPLTVRSTLFMKVGNRPFFAIFAALALVFLFGVARLHFRKNLSAPAP